MNAYRCWAIPFGERHRILGTLMLFAEVAVFMCVLVGVIALFIAGPAAMIAWAGESLAGDAFYKAMGILLVFVVVVAGLVVLTKD